MAKLDFPALERRILEFWEREKCFERLLQKNRDKPRWSFIDGPITANNPMGVHHAWGRTYKDVFQRYHAMKGRQLRYQNGFDCQGLWVEVEVEKELEFQSKRDIEDYGIGPFVQKCKERVLKFADIQTQQSIRLGYWMDWDDSYFTMSDENNYTIWQFLKRCHEAGYLYHGWDSMPWCPRCGTGISQHEISNEERPELTHTSPTVRFPLLDRENEYLLAWTTTPWTLTSNVASAVHPELTYVKASQGSAVYYLIEERLETVVGKKGPFKVLERMPGEALVGWEYKGPFDELPAQEGVRHRVIPWKGVGAEEGTGIVHIAPGCGKEDFELGREFDLPSIGPIDEGGIFVSGFGPLQGKHAAEVAPEILESLRDKDILYDAEEYTHKYPICWRCKTPLLFRLVDEWFISMDELRHRIIEVTKQTQWIPEHGLKLELDWLENMHDWMISKKRYWGLALPIYKCEECSNFEVIGSKEELRERAVEGWDEFEGNSPHRPWVDAVKIACSSCGKPVSRIPDVGNPWLDAGIVPYSTLHYNHDREYWEKWFPADWISESFPGQFRNWFYAILAMSTVMENRPPFKLIFGYQLMKDEAGEEMHKSKGNAVDFNDAAEREGADAMRWLFASHNPQQDLRFGYNRIHEARREFLVLWNVYTFFNTYAPIDNFDPYAQQIPVQERSDLDRWILSRLGRHVEETREGYEAYAVHQVMRDVNLFIGDLSRWYLRRSRRRIWKSANDQDKLAAYQTLWECLEIVNRLLAPIIPFVSEAIYQDLVKRYDPDAPLSVHLCDFPAAGEIPVDEELLESMQWVQAIVEQGHSARQKAALKVRQPLAQVCVVLPKRQDPGRLESLTPLILDELNVKSVRFTDDPGEFFEESFHLDGKLGKPVYKQHFNSLRDDLASMDPTEAKAKLGRDELVLEAGGQTFQIPAEYVRVEKEAREGWEFAEGETVTVALSTDLDDDLRREGLVRDLVRQVQILRKKADLEVDCRILLHYSTDDWAAEAVEEHRDYIAEETLAKEIQRGTDNLETPHEVGLGDHRFEIAFDPVAAD